MRDVFTEFVDRLAEKKEGLMLTPEATEAIETQEGRQFTREFIRSLKDEIRIYEDGLITFNQLLQVILRNIGEIVGLR